MEKIPVTVRVTVTALSKINSNTKNNTVEIKVPNSNAYFLYYLSATGISATQTKRASAIGVYGMIYFG